MYSNDPEYAQHTVSVLLYRAILSVWAQVIAWETEWKTVNRNLVEAVVSDCAHFIVTSCVLPIVLNILFGTIVGVLDSVKR